ncbi:hypothetical protein HBN99_21475 [Pseudomonas oryzihabitans]|uniref:hypothetical protein n=1 Tax=Pseudomonas oryzihabitans TaxID=47885 RepID=UPI001475C59B|nr:hypothetical protein [Pseudomonas oryzihabitans]NMZ66894.1 hypothetical protein [Pseudomonas oryzihabitans]
MLRFIVAKSVKLIFHGDRNGGLTIPFLTVDPAVIARIDALAEYVAARPNELAMRRVLQRND